MMPPGVLDRRHDAQRVVAIVDNELAEVQRHACLRTRICVVAAPAHDAAAAACRGHSDPRRDTVRRVADGQVERDRRGGEVAVVRRRKRRSLPKHASLEPDRPLRKQSESVTAGVLKRAVERVVGDEAPAATRAAEAVGGRARGRGGGHGGREG